MGGPCRILYGCRAAATAAAALAAMAPPGQNTAMAPLHPLHRLWRALPADARRRWLARGTGAAGPPAGPAAAARAARRDRRRRAGPRLRPGRGRPADAGRAGGAGRARLADARRAALPGEAEDVPLAPSGPPPAGAPLVLHVNAPHVAAALLRLPRGLAARAPRDRLLGVGAAGGAGGLGARRARSCTRCGRPPASPPPRWSRCCPGGCAWCRTASPPARRPRRAGPAGVRAAGGRGGDAVLVQPGLVVRAQEPAGGDRGAPGGVRRRGRTASW